MDYVKITLPTNYRKHYKRKPGYKNSFIGLNWFRNAHHFSANAIKKYYTELVTRELANSNSGTFNEYEIKSVFNYERADSDLDNSVVVTKFMNDAIQTLGLVKNDNVKHCRRIILEVGDKAKRGEGTIEMTIKEFEDSNDVEELIEEVAKLTSEVTKLNEELNSLQREL